MRSRLGAERRKGQGGQEARGRQELQGSGRFHEWWLQVSMRYGFIYLPSQCKAGASISFTLAGAFDWHDVRYRGIVVIG